ncbi:MAG TPA: hypothetical protein VH440_10915 [Candidatus Limnocylindrales bacterium]|jgi:hypothetical protein
MEALAMIAAILVGLVGFDLFALFLGTDSRDGTRDHRTWPIN